MFFLNLNFLSKFFHVSIKLARRGVVPLSGEEYEGLIETAELLSTPGFKQSIQRSLHQMEKSETFSMKDIFGDEDKGNFIEFVSLKKRKNTLKN